MQAPAPYPHDINVDLHMHSTASDGELSPSDLVARAHGNGVRIMALTDHDTLAGQAEARATALALGIFYICGVEISVTWGGQTLHIVGLDIDPQDAGIQKGLASIQAGRQARAVQMADALKQEGLGDLLQSARSHARNPDLIGRTHFARAMVERGLCTDMADVFSRYLVPGKPGYVAHQWASLTEAVGWICGAGGMPVLAHPARYRLNALTQWALIEEFKTLGGKGIEVVTASHTEQESRRYQRVSIEHGLDASRGSDFHGPDESRFDVGRVPPLPDATRPIWHAWAHC